MISVGEGSLSKGKTYPGFTIVELLIVVVVIAVLAAVVLVAYNGVTYQSKVSAIQSSASQAGKKTLMYAVQNEETAPLEASFRSDLGLPNDTATVTYQYYTSNDRRSFCISTTDTSVSPAVSYAQTNKSGGTVKGRCVKNLVVNPSFETGTTSWSLNSSVTGADTTPLSTPAGSTVYRVWRTAAGDSYAAHTLSSTAPATSPYTLSFWIWTDTSVALNGNLLFRTYDGGVCCVNLNSLGSYASTTTPTRVYMSGTTSANPTTGLQTILRVTSTVSQYVYYDGFMITEGLSQLSYGDGTSTNWAWTGTAHASTSFGPSIQN